MAIAVPTTTENLLTPAEARHFHMLEGRIERGLQTFQEVGAALTEIRDSQLYRATHPSFEAYCQERWDLGRDRAYQLIDAAEVVEVLGIEEGPTNEAQARELRALLHEGGETAVRETWKEVKATGKPVTAAVIREVAQAHMGVTITPAPSMTEQVVDRVLGLVNLYRKWDASKPSRKDRTTVKAAFDKLADLTG